ncbi:GAF domain-containing protein [Streptomyces sp. VRA16 Mangrove soil]|uniref:GAF domain-containing protein n=1 Tax=Streptomyces sp. VRA16 Mangrove soil TaxID=2817434 RepID=UPI001A9DC599|nr:GAF domain-containing protein [Streptomyces sp. VRA16 Mangrove soil]MBO1329727.1 GAF domain-containing protein [Streptomyces sp. VRA16 Mangrove soil]
MTYDANGRLLVTPVDKEGPERARRLRRLDLGQRPEPAFDMFADRLAEVTRAPYAMVNFIDENRQFFAGLHTPDGDHRGGELSAAAAESVSDSSVSRYMARDHGYCPHVVVRRKALVLEDVCDYPRFAGNPVVDEIGIRSYLGAPLIDDRTGLALGTVCVVDTEPRPWGRSGLAIIKAMASELMDVVRRRGDLIV